MPSADWTSAASYVRGRPDHDRDTISINRRGRPPQGCRPESGRSARLAEEAVLNRGDVAVQEAGEEVVSKEVDSKEVDSKEVDSKEVDSKEVDSKEEAGRPPLDGTALDGEETGAGEA
jgi:hypothetical protein